MALQRGTKLGPYQIESPIGAGGMGASDEPNVRLTNAGAKSTG